MQNTIQTIQRQLEARALGTVVFLGAGSGTDLELILERSPRRLVAVEGDADQAAALRRRLAGQASVEVRAEVVSPEGGRQPWFHYNLRRLGGLLQAGEGLRGAYPRLAEMEQSSVDTLAMGSWLPGIVTADPENTEDNLLVFDVAGLEGALLQSLADDGLDAFPWLAVRGAAEPMFEGGSTMEQVRARMAELGFHIVDTDTREELWPVDLYHADPRARRLLRAQRALATARSDLATVTSDLQARCDQLAEQQSVEQDLRSRLQELEALLASRDQALAEAEQHSQALAEDVKRLTREAESARAEHERWRASQGQQLTKATGRAEQLSRELAEARTTASHAIKLQMLREADLKDLQLRHEQLRAEQRSRQELLLKLGQRLSVANEHFARLADTRGDQGVAEADLADSDGKR